MEEAVALRIYGETNLRVETPVILQGITTDTIDELNFVLVETLVI